MVFENQGRGWTAACPEEQTYRRMNGDERLRAIRADVERGVSEGRKLRHLALSVADG